MANKVSSYEVNTFNQELLQCVALAFFTRMPEPLRTSEDFYAYIQNYLAENNDNQFKILDGVGAEYNRLTNLGVFNTTSKTGISWVDSSISIAQFLINKLKLNEHYKIYHQKSSFGRTIKERCIQRLIEDLDLSKFSDEPDTYNPTDIWIVKETESGKITKRLEDQIINANDGMVSANYTSNKNTYKSIIGEYFRAKSLYQISLKKASSKGVKYRVIGSSYGIPAKDVDPYTRFISIFDDLVKTKNETKIKEFISKLVVLKKINYKDETLQPSVSFELRYEKIDVSFSGEIEKWLLDTPGNTFNMQKEGGTAWSGGTNFNGIHLALKNYSEYMPTFREMKQLRYRSYEQLYSKLFPGKAVPTNIKNILIRKDQIIYMKKDMDIIKESLENEENYKQFLVDAIEKLSSPYRGQKALYGITSTGSIDIQTTTKSGEIVNKLKSDQGAIALSLNPIAKGQTKIQYSSPVDYKNIKKRTAKLKQIKVGDTIFIRKIGSKSESSSTEVRTKVKRINLNKKEIELTKPITSGGSGQFVAIIFNPFQTNILSNQKLRTIDTNILEQKFSKLQPFWMFMRGGPKKLSEFLKKQIVLTIYGIVSKKGGKIFDDKFTSKHTLGEELIKTKNALGKYIIPQFIIVGD